jgi:hypothetical protein
MALPSAATPGGLVSESIEGFVHDAFQGCDFFRCQLCEFTFSSLATQPSLIQTYTSHKVFCHSVRHFDGVHNPTHGFIVTP